jgi:hypothetical protein
MRGRGAALLSFLALIGGSASSATAQALDIGGIELRLGQPPEDALRSLASYQVQFVESRWFVSQKIGARYELIGNFSATGDAITFIGKSFPIKSDGDVSEVNTVASKELRRRGGNACSTREAEYTDNLINGFETQCGAYKLTYTMPWKLAQGSATANVQLFVRSQ